ncbi:MAG TPA: GNAT family N-acetyltransferase [Rhizomicrobium sp.]|nr:GNAT family N-acetyltransferase [Rhizomicrobium sp.]
MAADIRLALEPITSLAPLETLWRKLEAGSGASFFVSWTWIGTWLRCLPETIRPQLLIATRNGDAIAAAVLVARRERRRGVLNVRQLHFNSTGDPRLDCIMIEHNGFVARAEENQDIWAAFLRWFAKHAEADELVVPGMVEGTMGGMGGDASLLHRSVRMPGFACDLAQGGREALLARLSANARQQLRRSLRDCETLGPLRIETAPDTAAALAWLAELKVLHIASWTRRGHPHAFRRAFFEIFHRALIEAGTTNGRVRLRRVSAGISVLGYLYDFRDGERVYAYQSGFGGQHTRLRPGYVCHMLAMEQDAREGARSNDFLGGDNRLKRSLGNHIYTLGRHRFGHRTAGLQLEAAAIHLVSGLRIGGGSPHSPGRGKPI